MAPGDRELLRLCEQLQPRLVGSLTIICGDRGAAEELAQETLIRVWDRWARVRTLESPEGWAYRVAVNLSRSWWRRENARRRAHDRLAQQQAAEVPELDPAAALAVRAAVAALPTRQRQVLALRFFAGCSVDQTAQALGCATGTVKSHTARATAALRRLLTDEEVSRATRP